MSPILIRPVREQLEHDRIIRLLQAKWKRKHDVQMNVGDEQVASVKSGTLTLYPDLVLNSVDAPRRLQGVVEIETGESVNNLEAMAQWANLAKLKAAFYLYVPAGSLDIARRLCEEYRIVPTELWTYSPIGDQLRFTIVQKTAPPELPLPRVEKVAARAKEPARPKEKTARPAKARKIARPSRVAGRRPAAPAKRKGKVAPARAATARPGAARKSIAKARPRPARAQKRR